MKSVLILILGLLLFRQALAETRDSVPKATPAMKIAGINEKVAAIKISFDPVGKKEWAERLLDKNLSVG